MIVRRGPAVVLSLALMLAGVLGAPAANARASAVKDSASCSGHSTVRLRVVSEDDGVLRATGTVFAPGTDLWSWRFKHNDDVSAHGTVRAHRGPKRAFQVTRSMVNLIGPDHFVFWAENLADGEVCRVDVFY